MNIYRYSGILGVVIFLLVAFLLSNNRKKIPYNTVIYGMITQFLIALFMLKTPVGVKIFRGVNQSLSPRTMAITTYALCGFAHFGSIAILLVGLEPWYHQKNQWYQGLP